MGTVFISYRRADSIKDARALYERLRRELGEHHVFIDLEGIEPGEDFITVIEKHLEGCDALLVLIGRDWLGAADEIGRTRIHHESDFVRIEIGTALRRGIRVFPVLLDGAAPPASNQLPDELRPMIRRQALSLDYARFDQDIAKLARALKTALEQSREVQTKLAVPTPLVPVKTSFLSEKVIPIPVDDSNSSDPPNSGTEAQLADVSAASIEGAHDSGPMPPTTSEVEISPSAQKPVEGGVSVTETSQQTPPKTREAPSLASAAREPDAEPPANRVPKFAMVGGGALIAILFIAIVNPSTPVDGVISAEQGLSVVANSPVEYRISKILVDSEGEAKRLISRIQQGERFEDLAKRYSKDEASASRGGDAGFYSTTTSMSSALSSAVLNLKVGEITTSPVPSGDSYLIVRLDDKQVGSGR